MKRLFCLTVFMIAILAAAQNSHAALITYTANLDGPSESPPIASSGTGLAQVDYDDIAHTLRVLAVFSGLTGDTTASHIHAATATPFTGTSGVAITPGTFPAFPLGVKSGSYDYTLDMTLFSTYTLAFLTNFGGGSAAGAEGALIDAMESGQAYFNIHTSFATGGEIRGFLTHSVPEPTTMLLLGLGLVGLAGVRRKSKM